ncbi:MAG: DUF624 domain-containing protein [Clostridiales bacterium]|nr:DUF624 domain-containing protein [Clostridiales bacterium]
MNGIFNPENRFWTFMEKVMNLCVLGILWFLFSLPLVTIGASTTALFTYTLRLVYDEEGYLLQSFWRGFRRHFRTATILWLGAVVLGGCLVAELYACQFLPGGKVIVWGMRAVFVSLLLIYALTLLYLFPVLAEFSLPGREVLAESLVMAVGNLPCSLLILLIAGVCGVVSWLFPELFMIWFAFAMYGASFFFHAVFRRSHKNSDNIS